MGSSEGVERASNHVSWFVGCGEHGASHGACGPPRRREHVGGILLLWPAGRTAVVLECKEGIRDPESSATRFRDTCESVILQRREGT